MWRAQTDFHMVIFGAIPFGTCKVYRKVVTVALFFFTLLDMFTYGAGFEIVINLHLLIIPVSLSRFRPDTKLFWRRGVAIQQGCVV